MKTVYKYPLLPGVENRIQLSGEPVLVAEQSNGIRSFGPSLMLWAEFDSDVEPRERTFEVIGTGHNVPEGARHIGSIVSPPLVLHVFETGLKPSGPPQPKHRFWCADEDHDGECQQDFGPPAKAPKLTHALWCREKATHKGECSRKRSIKADEKNVGTPAALRRNFE